MSEPTAQKAPDQVRQRVFIVRPWHSPEASLYPHTMDGVEYVNAVIKTIKKVFVGTRFEVRVDEEVFVPGITIRENLERELTNAEVVLAILDGLRPNVVYELGLAYGQQEDSEGSSSEPSPRIVCLADRDATVLVRNYYPNPMSVPTTKGDDVTILNPPLNMATAFSDNADLLLLTYSRLDLDGTLGESLNRLINDLQSQESKTQIISNVPKEPPPSPLSPIAKVDSGPLPASTSAAAAENAPANAAKPPAPLRDIWDLYESGRYADVVAKIGTPGDDEQKKVLALSQMKLGQIYEAMRIWRELASSENATAFFHLGICLYVVGRFEQAAYYIEKASRIEDSDRTKNWLSRVLAKIAQRQGGTLAVPPSSAQAPNRKPANEGS